MSLFVEAVEVDEVGDVDLDVVVGLVVTLPMTRTHSLPAELLIIRFLLKEMLGSLLKDAVMVDHEFLTVVVVVEVSAMVKLVKVKTDDLEEHLIVAVGLDEGDVIFDEQFLYELLFLSILMSLGLFAEMNSNVKVQDEVTGEPKLMNLFSKNSF